MIKIGMMIGDRYEILEKIGTGGMSDVYKAKCHKLNRLVAVKVLKQEFSENANFVSKFQVEAQAAAGLMHPNIVNVYDVGEENGVYYIVMELVEGLTLKKYIEKKARLSVKESLTIATQISLGIEAAHNNHIIHRDIKPQNVIISKEGKVKVTDFGIAKAATSNTITSNVMGSVHYTSPEQARGGFSDEKSDIYSLGITLFEMLTGRVPFNGETTVAIAIKQIQEEMPSPREFVSEIPVSVEKIVLKCTQKSPDRRYQSMSELIEDLRHSYTNPDDDFVKIQTDDEFGATRTLSDEEMEKLQQTVKETSHNTESISVELPKVNPVAKEDEYDPKMDKVTTILAIVVAGIILVVAFLLIGKIINQVKLNQGSSTSISASEETGEMEEVPDVTLMSFDAAKETLEKKGFEVKLLYEESSEYAEGLVIKTSVHEGLKAQKGSLIEVTVSAGLYTVIVPDVVGSTLSAANKAIMDKKLKVTIIEEYSDSVVSGVVMSQVPGGNEKAPLDATVVITVSKGQEIAEFAMPDLLGYTEESAIKCMEDYQLVVRTTKYVYSEIYAKGLVCGQSVERATPVKAGSAIDLEISMGREEEGAKRYKFSGNILAPTTLEDADYASGTEVHIVITTHEKDVIFDTNTTSFPVSVNILNIVGSGKGTITMTYSVTLDDSISIDPVTGAKIVVPGTTETRMITREIDFTPDEQD